MVFSTIAESIDEMNRYKNVALALSVNMENFFIDASKDCDIPSLNTSAFGSESLNLFNSCCSCALDSSMVISCPLSLLDCNRVFSNIPAIAAASARHKAIRMIDKMFIICVEFS